MNSDKPIASVSLDLDNAWSYLRTHGESGWEDLPSYLDLVIPRVLEFLATRNLTITVFIVGQDASLKKNHRILRSIADAGHEVANHSFHHEPWMHRYTREQVQLEIMKAEEAIEQATGRTPVGFRGPGYSLSPAILDALTKRGYVYDASTLPNSLAPVARAYYFTTAEFTAAQKKERRTLGGTFREALQPIKPYGWRLGSRAIVEIPVTTMPVLRLPMHQSYLVCLAVRSRGLALNYFNIAVKLCRLTGIGPSFLLHPTDFLGAGDGQALSFIPGMNLPVDRKLELVREVICKLTDHFTLGTVRCHADATMASDLRFVEPRFGMQDPTEAVQGGV